MKSIRGIFFEKVAIDFPFFFASLCQLYLYWAGIGGSY
ncbi:hypothetical protein EDC28_108108 [Gallaecimonas pentaromativorans]|uniref:Uncharacterized protein n=1 Tax=Gallaecimonas pentaromativorans TaxID=584787 RepID=A0A3N1P9B2_9GAMM|nr:hypothetical protein EDC28_108108 [Gallaecimonas pentaromativorans]